MKLKKKTRKGFTLIELLIVVAIIAILAAIAIPQFAKYRVRGYNSAADSDLRNMKIAIEAFATDNQVYASTKGCTSGTSTCSGGDPGKGVLLSGPLSYTVTVTSGAIMSSPSALPSATVNMLFGLSNGVLAGITSNSTSGQEGSQYVAVTSNTSGDTIYASDSMLTSLMRAGKDGSGSPVPIASGQAGGTLTYIPTAATGGTGDLDSNFVAM